MSKNPSVGELLSSADSLGEFVEQADNAGISRAEQAAQVIANVWDRKIPEDRARRILDAEAARAKEYSKISLTKTSRAPRYTDIADLQLVSGYEFEHILAEILRRVEGGTTVTEAAGDQGVDVIWHRENETIGIQAKAYTPDNPVGNSAVQEIHTGVVARDWEYDIDSAAVVTTSQYTSSAKEAAENTGVTLYTRSDLADWLSKAELDAETLGEVLERA